MTQFFSFVLLAAGEDRLWLVLDDGVSGEELWQSDGTAAGTTLVRDLTPGPRGTSFQGGLFPWRDRVLFGHLEDALGIEPWLSDGTPEGTRRLKDICQGECSSAPTSYAALDDGVVFEAWDEEHGRELWRTDGTEAGTLLVADLCPGTCNGVADDSPLVAFGDEVFFTVRSRASVALWGTDGTGPGTRRVKDICIGLCAESSQIFDLGDELYLVTDSGREIWRSDGTDAGTHRVHRLAAEYYVNSPLVRVTQQSFFFTGKLGSAANQLWRTDGTDAGTQQITEPGSVSPFAAPVGDRMVFPAGTQPELTLWVTDGTAAGTHELRDVEPGSFTVVSPTSSTGSPSPTLVAVPPAPTTTRRERSAAPEIPARSEESPWPGRCQAPPHDLGGRTPSTSIQVNGTGPSSSLRYLSAKARMAL